jgi:hypothetical protein
LIKSHLIWDSGRSVIALDLQNIFQNFKISKKNFGSISIYSKIAATFAIAILVFFIKN